MKKIWSTILLSSVVSFRFAVVTCVTISYSHIVYKEEEGTQKTEILLSKSLKIKIIWENFGSIHGSWF